MGKYIEEPIISDISNLSIVDGKKILVCDNIDGGKYKNKVLDVSQQLHGGDRKYFNNCEDLYFQNITNLEGYKMYFNGGFFHLKIDRIFFNLDHKSKIQDLCLYYSGYTEGLDSISINNSISNFDSNINEIYIKNSFLSKEGDSKIKNLKISSFYLDDFNNYSENFILQNLEIQKLVVKNSDLGKMKFNGVIIHELYLENVTLNDCIFNSVDFPKNYELSRNEGFDGRKTTTFLPYKKLKDNYRQLKYVMDKNGNITEANKFFEKEMGAYMDSLGIEKNGFIGTIKFLHKSNYLGNDVKTIGERINLSFGYVVSEFGNNWIKPLSGIFFLAFSGMVFSLCSTIMGEQKYIEGYTGIFYPIDTQLITFSYFNNYIGDIIFSIFLLIGFFSLFIVDNIKNIYGICASCLMAKVPKWMSEGYVKILTKLPAALRSKSTSLIIFVFKKIFNYKMFFFILSLFILVSLLTFDINFDLLKVFGNLLNPLYFKETGVEYNGIEILGLVLYKTIYGILLYHLLIALKRTTKR